MTMLDIQWWGLPDIYADDQSGVAFSLSAQDYNRINGTGYQDKYTATILLIFFHLIHRLLEMLNRFLVPCPYHNSNKFPWVSHYWTWSRPRLQPVFMESFQNKLNRAMKNHQGSWMSVYSIFFSMFNRLYDVSGTKNKLTSARPDYLLALKRKWSCSGPGDPCRCPTRLNKYSSQPRINTGIYCASRMNRERSSDNPSHPPLTSPSGLPNGSSTMTGGAWGIFFKTFPVKCYK